MAIEYCKQMFDLERDNSKSFAPLTHAMKLRGASSVFRSR